MNKLQALELSTGLANLVTGMEEELLRNIAAYLLSGKAETESGKWKIRKLAELGKLNKKNIETIKSYIPYEKDMAELTLKRAAVDAFAHAESGFRRMVIDGLVKDAPTGSMDATMQRTLKMLGKQAATDLNLVNTTMQIKAKQMANTAVHKAAELAGNQEFLDMLNRAAGKTVTGTESMTAAVSTCLKDMAQKGIPGFVDKSGRKWTPEAYVNMCVRTTASNTAHQAMFERMKDYKQRIIEVSSHSGARPKCAKDQGKLYDLDNGSGYVEDVNGKKIRYYAFSSTSYGKPDGLFGINCRHKMYPFVPGCSTQTYFPYDEEENAAQYKKVQKQRELERKVRASKRECMMLKDGDPEMFQKASVKLKHNTQQLKTYCSNNDLMYMNERTSVMGYGRSEAGKVTAAYNRALKQEQEKLNKALDKTGGSGIIKLSSKFINPTDQLYTNANNIKPLKGYGDIIMHGSPDSLLIYGLNDERWEYGAKEAAEMIRNSREFHGQPIRLVACQTGAKENGIAQQIADELGIKVMAPTEIVNVDFDGKIFLSDNGVLADIWNTSSAEEKKKFRQTGKWKIFKPNKGGKI